jgi:hypothetical protein
MAWYLVKHGDNFTVIGICYMPIEVLWVVIPLIGLLEDSIVSEDLAAAMFTSLQVAGSTGRHNPEDHESSRPWKPQTLHLLHGPLESRQGLGIFLSTTLSRPVLGPTQPPIQWVPGALSLGVKRPGREADHSPPSNAEVKNAWRYNSTPPIRLHGVVWVKTQGQLYLIFTYKKDLFNISVA